MKNIQFISLIILILLGIGSTHYVLSQVPEKVKAGMLAIEYDKVGGIENYVKINKLQKEQVIAGLKQYEAQNGKIPSAQVKANNAPVIAPAGTTLSLEQAKKITSDNVNVLGNKDAEITWIEYSDLECPFCRKLHNSGTIEEIMKTYGGKVNFVFKQFPLSFHPNAEKEAEAALCAGEIGGSDKYFSYISKIFERTRSNGRGFALDALVPLATELGLDKTEFKSCLDSNKYADRVQKETNEGSSIFGVTGTPGNVLINNKTGKWDKLPGAYPTASFKQKIDALLK